MIEQAGQLFNRAESGFTERIDPDHFPSDVAQDHLARYRWAARSIRGHMVLDIACGTGYGSPLLRRYAKSVTGADLHQKGLEFGRIKYGLTAVRADAASLPFRDRAFDGVVSLETIEHLADPTAFVSEVKRVLRNSGSFLLSVPNKDVISSAQNPFHVGEYDLDQLRRLVANSGFRVSRVLGQHWRVRGKVIWGTRGLRRSAWMFQRLNRVMPRHGLLGDPEVWCLVCTLE